MGDHMGTPDPVGDIGRAELIDILPADAVLGFPVGSHSVLRVGPGNIKCSVDLAGVANPDWPDASDVVAACVGIADRSGRVYTASREVSALELVQAVRWPEITYGGEVILRGLRCATQDRGALPSIAQPGFQPVAFYSRYHGVVVDVLVRRLSAGANMADELVVRVHPTERAGVGATPTPQVFGVLRGIAALVLLPHSYHRVTIGRHYTDRAASPAAVFVATDRMDMAQEAVVIGNS
jgi:hypothetical protein